MTTATDWEVRDAETGEHPVVTDVTSAAPEHVMELRTAHALAIRNAELSEQVERLGRENAELRAAMGAWVPPQSSLRTRRDRLATLRTPRQVTGIGDLSDAEKHLAMVAPTAEELTGYDDDLGVVPNPIAGAVANTSAWPIWLGDVHHADKAVSQTVADLRSWPNAYAAQPVERTVVEPVAVDYSYRRSEAWALADLVRGQSRQPSVYAELAPDNIQNEPPPSDLTPAERAIVNDATQRRKKLAQAAQGERDELPPAQDTEPDGWVPATWWARALAWFSGRKRGL